MMTAEQLKPFLLHEDDFVRGAVAEWFQDSCSDDTTVLETVLQAAERFGVHKSRVSLRHSRNLPVSLAAFDAALRLFAASASPAAMDHLNTLLARAPIGLPADRLAALEATPNVTADTVKQARRRSALAARSAGDLWSELQQYSTAMHGEHIDGAYASDLIEALAVSNVPDDDTLLRMLPDPAHEEDWLELFLVELAGRRRLRAAIPILVEKLSEVEDDDYLPVQVPEALARIGSAEAVPLLRPAFEDGDDGYAMTAAEALGRLKTPEAEDLALEAIDSQQDEVVRALLGHSLCKFFSARAVEATLRVIRDGYDTTVVHLDAELLPVAEVLGIALPDKFKWTIKRDAEERRIERLLDMAASVSLPELAETKSPDSREPPELPEPYRPPPPVPPSPPIVAKSKTGRNDPCPCGSGKKYKKCCERKPADG